MTHWMPTRVLVLFLGLWIALAPAIIAVPAAAMVSPMGMSDALAADGCDACPDMPLADMGRGLCMFMCCGAVSFAVLPEVVELTLFRELVSWLSSDPFFSGRSLKPSPTPPKTLLP